MKKKLRVLVTAGSTWVAIDKVRVITNIFGGALGINIAKVFADRGDNVTLLVGPGRAELPKETKNLNIIKFKYFDDLLKLMKKEVAKNYDAVIHSAAVSDYKPSNVFQGKIKSGIKKSIIHLIPTIKILDLIKKISNKSVLVKFKLEVGVKKGKLIQIAKKSMKQSCADYIVANEFSEIKRKHKAYLIDQAGKVEELRGRERIADELFKTLHN